MSAAQGTILLQPEAGFGGASEAAQFIWNAIREVREGFRQSNVLGIPQALSELEEVFKECGEANWDGYDALPVTRGAYTVARQVLDSLPLGTPSPSIGAEPDGHITLEWHRSDYRTLSVSVSPEGLLHYAALLGSASRKRYGTEPFLGGEMPNVILELISEVLPRGS